MSHYHDFIFLSIVKSNALVWPSKMFPPPLLRNFVVLKGLEMMFLYEIRLKMDQKGHIIPGPRNRRTRRTCAEDQRKLGGPKSWLTKFSSLDS